MGRVLKTSDDGSHTIYDDLVNETYHSVYGAITESEHVFIEACYIMLKKNQVKVLEVGFGTGLNAWLTSIFSKKFKRKTFYESYELYPLEEFILSQLNFFEVKYSGSAISFHDIHQSAWGFEKQITEEFTLKKIYADFTTTILSNTYDAVYFDAFSPDKQPELWTYEIFKKIFNVMSEGGILTTYCAKGYIKRMMKEIGFVVEVIPGPPGKRHMIRALKL
jgi:tRNA U34 5-methylaminomethyl-2-thiouridine-forming methyltransferase MnmC